MPQLKIQLAPVFGLLACLTLFAGAASATGPDELSNCGGDGQRACCWGEAFPSCDDGLVETGVIHQDPCLFGFPAGTCGTLDPNKRDFCGGHGQRACCVGEATPSCDNGNDEIGPATNQCGPTALFPNAFAGTCYERTPCGAAGQRACTLSGQPCEEGLLEIGGCGDPTTCFGSISWCYQPTPCGGKRERACCTVVQEDAIAGNLELDPCQDGLTEIFGLAGDSNCGAALPFPANFFPVPSAGTCVDLATLGVDIEEPEIGWNPAGGGVAVCESEQRGYADLHVHMFGHLAHGGGVLAGTPYDELGGINDALAPDFATNLDLVTKRDEELPAPSCDTDLYGADCGGDRVFHGIHSVFDDGVGVGTHEGTPLCSGLACGAASNFGSPVFNGWPTWRSTTHQQVYYKWLERAWRGGLRLMVQLAVTNEALCRSSKHLRDTDCNDEMAPVDAQIDATWAFQDWIDEQSGGPGLGWFRVVTTPDEAREVIADGKLAVVIGIEVANLFNCKKDGCSGKNEGESDAQYVQRKVKDYHAKGVRIIFPIHNFDNAFGSPATWQNAIDVGNFVSEGAWWEAEDCPGEDYGFKIGDFGGVLSQFLINAIAFGNWDGGVAPDHDGDASCNAKGLTPLGAYLIEYMMDEGIIIDVDHMSNKAFDETISIANELHRPVIASHVQFFDLNKEEIRHERMRTRAQLEAIRNTGGMVAAMLKDDVQDTDNVGKKLNLPYTPASGRVVSDDCRHSSKTWAQMYQYAVDVMQGPVAMGSDFNGVAGHIGPRFGLDACGNRLPSPLDLLDPIALLTESSDQLAERSAQARAGNRLAYPFILPGFGTFDKQVTGLRTFDFNTNGLAHIGLLPDLVKDLEGVGLSSEDLEPLFGSALAFVDVWDRAGGTPVPPRSIEQLGCEPQTVAANTSCQASLSIADADTQANPNFDLVQNPPGPYGLGTTLVTLAADLGDACAARPASCQATVTVVDETGPSITCPASPVAECTSPAGANVAFDQPQLEPDNCTPGVFLPVCTANTGDLFPLGTTGVSCTAQDGAETPNQSDCNIEVQVVDTTAPSITCPADITKECTGDASAPVTPGAASGSDVCGEVALSTHAAAGFPLGTTPLEYTATDDAGLVSRCTAAVTVEDTTPPTITCPADITSECTGNLSAAVTPGAALGSDVCADVELTSYPTASYSLGNHELVYTATDIASLTDTCSSSITVQDTTVPTIDALEVAPNVLWPPNHKMVEITTTLAASDVCDPAPVVELLNITVDEGDETLTFDPAFDEVQGDGITLNDIQVESDGRIFLRAERSGKGDGRVYTITYRVTDSSGNTAMASATVTVPHDG